MNVLNVFDALKRQVLSNSRNGETFKFNGISLSFEFRHRSIEDEIVMLATVIIVWLGRQEVIPVAIICHEDHFGDPHTIIEIHVNYLSDTVTVFQLVESLGFEVLFDKKTRTVSFDAQRQLMC